MTSNEFENISKQQPARGQARIPSIAVALELMAQAMQSGWGNKNGDRVGFEYDV
ncbi:hypothetical protein [uncultured Fibrobacter sp.]|uniref:hypothetical protein n=1 Tax=uncultured Fibrobacter sp. TaxID=261512 RepID=UPI0025D4D9CA|nr:hypothetical protein [uncultured Fibrobacter sp.]